MSVNEYPKEVLEALERDQGIRFKGRYAGAGDARLAYGAICTWFGSIHQTKPTSGGLPGCPFCGGVLFEMNDEGEWWSSVDQYEREKPHPGYRAMWEWQRTQKQCFSLRNGVDDLVSAYRAAHKSSEGTDHVD